ncbi:MAG: histidine kinase [Ilumatobacteraceae bacterium]
MSLRGSIGVTMVGTVLILVGLAAAWEWQFHRTSEDFAIREVGRTGELAGRSGLGPFITDEFVAGDPAALQRFETAADTLIRSGDLVHLEVWSSTGKLLWADTPALVGTVVELEPEERALMESQGVMVEFAHDVSRPAEEQFLAVDFGTKTALGDPVVVELFYPTSILRTLAADERRSFRPLVFAGLALLAAVQIPLALAMRNRRRHLFAEREKLVQRSMLTSDSERRRIAAEVHDGAVQDLIGITIGLAAAADAAPSPMKEHIHELAGETRRTVRGLRSLLNSIYPVDVPGIGWHRGLDPIVEALRQRGVVVDIDVPDFHPSPVNQLLMLRVGREALRNISAHSQASNVTISLTRQRTTMTLEITDDGVGFDEGLATSKRESGHLGLRLLYDLAEDTGATLLVDSQPGAGTTVHLEVEEIR